MFNIIKALRTAVTKYKARRVQNVVTRFTKLAAFNINGTVPIVLGTYHDAANHIVAKTFENPDVANDLLISLDRAIKYYGPGLKDIAVFAAAQFEAQRETMESSNEMAQFEEALDKMESDVTS